VPNWGGFHGAETQRSQPVASVPAMVTYVLRLWLPDRPGALGSVASRVGAVGADVVGIEILERGAERAIDELVIEMPDAGLLDLLVSEVEQVDGVSVEEARLLAEAVHDPRLDALETAAMLVGATTPDEALESLCVHAVRTIGAAWGAVVALDLAQVAASVGDAPSAAWLAAFVSGSQSAARAAGDVVPEDIVWAPLPSARAALVLGRDAMAFRLRERRQAAALARIVDTRFHELNVLRSRTDHPAGPTTGS
jgi:hypothetical protein